MTISMETQLPGGLTPAELKRFLGRNLCGFNTGTAASAFMLGEPLITDILDSLAREDWIRYANDNGVRGDRWEIGDQGMRLIASRIGKRFPAREGQALIEALLTEARAINADPGHTSKVAGLRLFGSMLDAGPDDLVGDVDVIVDIWRTGDRDALDAEIATAPAGMRHYETLFWPTTRVVRRLEAISRKIALSDSSVLDNGEIRYRPLYHFDPNVMLEQAVEDRILRSPPRAEEPEPVQPPPARGVPVWSEAAGRVRRLEVDSDIHDAVIRCRRAGLDTTTIAREIRAKFLSRTTHLQVERLSAIRPAMTRRPGKSNSIADTIADAMPHRPQDLHWSINLCGTRWQWISVEFPSEDDMTCVTMFNGNGRRAIVNGDLALAGPGLDACRAIAIWAERNRPKPKTFRELELAGVLPREFTPAGSRPDLLASRDYVMDGIFRDRTVDKFRIDFERDKVDAVYAYENGVDIIELTRLPDELRRTANPNGEFSRIEFRPAGPGLIPAPLAEDELVAAAPMP